MQAPTQTVPLDLVPIEEEANQAEMDLGDSVQRVVRFDLKEEGTHLLAVSLSYSEKAISKGESSSGARVRTFRKIYQFIAQPCLSVRTKVSDRSFSRMNQEKRITATPATFALEAQLENLADGPITLEKVTFSPKQAFESVSINWEINRPGCDIQNPLLAPRDVTQVAFLIKQIQRQGRLSQVESTPDGRTILGQLQIMWRNMGDPGFLSTGWLMTRKR
ncbi:MAG: hypothetical protein Q9190_001289 [Brigantiaea leucoxantha]